MPIASDIARVLVKLRWKKTSKKQRKAISKRLHEAKKAKKEAEAAP